VVWGIRSTEVDFSKYDWSFGATFRAGAALSRFVDLIIYNSHAGAQQYRRAGYQPKADMVIHNGIDVNRFCNRPDGRSRIRSEWHVRPDQCVVGLVGRFDPMKAQESFLAAAGELTTANPSWRFVLIGDNAGPYALELRRSAGARILGDRLIWAGARDDMPAVYSGLDCLVLASNRGEGLPNAVAEAMACERPCVVTDVGDAAFLVGDTGFVVPIGDQRSLVHACSRLMFENPAQRRQRGAAARRRIATEFSLEHLTSRTGNAFEALVKARGHARAGEP
jgi:glycosyltransferase involved in cell wall biosynthesis